MIAAAIYAAAEANVGAAVKDRVTVLHDRRAAIGAAIGEARPGDVVLTGTPLGSSVITPGDLVEVEVDGIGTLVNRVVVR